MLTDFATNAVRSFVKLFEGAGEEIEKHSSVDERLHEAVAALHRTADSMDRHVEVLDTLTESLPALTEVLAALSAQLGEVLRLAAPIESAEREVAGIGHLFRRHRHPAGGQAAGDPPA